MNRADRIIQNILDNRDPFEGVDDDPKVRALPIAETGDALQLITIREQQVTSFADLEKLRKARTQIEAVRARIDDLVLIVEAIYADSDVTDKGDALRKVLAEFGQVVEAALVEAAG